MRISEPARRTQPNSETAAEDYLKTIYHHTEWQAEPVTPSVLAATMGVAPSSVTEMAKKLSLAGLVNYEPYKPLTLTADGVRRARGVIRRHRLIEAWLVGEMGYAWHEVHDEAEVLEHSISERLLDAIDARLGHPTQDPHGDPIPSSDGTVGDFPARLVSQVAPGSSFVVVRISDRDPSLLEAMAAAGIRPGIEVRIDEPDAAGAAMRLTATREDGPGIDVTSSGASSIWVTVPA